MVAAVVFSSGPKLFPQANVGDRPEARGHRCKELDGTVTSCSPNSAAMDSGPLHSGMTRFSTDRTPTRFREQAMKATSFSSMLPSGLGRLAHSGGSNSALTSSGENGIIVTSCSSIVPALPSGILPNGMGRFRLPLRPRERSSCALGERWSFHNSDGRESRKKHRRWRVRATDEPEEGQAKEDGYWEGEEGKQQLNDIEDMLELIAEAENLRKADSAEGGPGELTSEEIEKQKAEKLREELARLARQQAEQRKQAEVMFGMGQRFYGRGVYDKSVALLEAALSNVPASSILGGNIQIWLAMAYEAHNRHADCIALYKRIEGSHPSRQLRRQAADLRYILEAPKLKISKEEMVSIPILDRNYDRRSAKTWAQKFDRRRKPMPKSKSKDYLEDWLVWDPPRWERNPYFWVAVTVWLTLVGVSLMFQD